MLASDRSERLDELITKTSFELCYTSFARQYNRIIRKNRNIKENQMKRIRALNKILKQSWLKYRLGDASVGFRDPNLRSNKISSGLLRLCRKITQKYIIDSDFDLKV